MSQTEVETKEKSTERYFFNLVDDLARCSSRSSVNLREASLRKTRVFGKKHRTGKTGNHNKTTMQGPTCFKAKSSLPSKNLGNLPAVTLHDLSQAKAEQQKQQSARCVGTIVTVSPPTQQPLLPGAADTSQKSWPILELVAQTSLVSVWTWHVHTRTEARWN